MYADICVCMYVYMLVYVCIHVGTLSYIYTLAARVSCAGPEELSCVQYACIYVCRYMCMYVCIYACVRLYTCLCIEPYTLGACPVQVPRNYLACSMHVYMYVCIY